MVVRLILLHLRWFALLVILGGVGVALYQGLLDGMAGLQPARLWSGLSSILGMCGALAVLAPWARFVSDPRRAEPVSVEGFAAYWKLR